MASTFHYGEVITGSEVAPDYWDTTEGNVAIETGHSLTMGRIVAVTASAVIVGFDHPQKPAERIDRSQIRAIYSLWVFRKSS
ncbi:hypothetical protein [Larkinella soli]|uniref:hypothetical protein n=1 Tax=Larkinella soli TaxID=1770527 RepID=UPI0019D2B421|nr:hypothetical protein [Larkinella soli]